MKLEINIQKVELATLKSSITRSTLSEILAHNKGILETDGPIQLSVTFKRKQIPETTDKPKSEAEAILESPFISEEPKEFRCAIYFEKVPFDTKEPRYLEEGYTNYKVSTNQKSKWFVYLTIFPVMVEIDSDNKTCIGPWYFLFSAEEINDAIKIFENKELKIIKDISQPWFLHNAFTKSMSIRICPELV